MSINKTIYKPETIFYSIHNKYIFYYSDIYGEIFIGSFNKESGIKFVKLGYGSINMAPLKYDIHSFEAAEEYIKSYIDNRIFL